MSPRYRLATLATLVAIPVILSAAALAYAHQAGGHHGSNDAHHIEMHLDHMARMLTRIGASDAQKTQIEVILRGAFTSLKAAKDEHHAAFGQLHELLFAPSIDRARIESLRAEQIRSLDDLSRRFAAAFEQAAEVLTAEQRVALAQEIRQHHGG